MKTIGFLIMIAACFIAPICFVEHISIIQFFNREILSVIFMLGLIHFTQPYVPVKELVENKNDHNTGLIIIVSGIVCVNVISFSYFQSVGINIWQYIFGILLCVAGLATRLHAMVTLGEGYDPFVKKPNKLVSSGLYNICTHPIYAGSLVFWIGISLLASGNILAIVFTTIVMSLSYYCRIIQEEKFLCVNN